MMKNTISRTLAEPNFRKRFPEAAAFKTEDFSPITFTLLYSRYALKICFILLI